MHVSAEDLATGSRRAVELDGRLEESQAASRVVEARATELEDIFAAR